MLLLPVGSTSFWAGDMCTFHTHTPIVWMGFLLEALRDEGDIGAKAGPEEQNFTIALYCIYIKY